MLFRSYIHLTTAREEPRHLVIPLEVYERQRERMERRIESVKKFAFDATECRTATLLRYFGEQHDGDCGTCDVCRAARRTAMPRRVPDIDESILYHARRPGGADIADIIGHLAPTFGRDELIAAIRTLADKKTLILEGTRVRGC